MTGWRKSRPPKSAVVKVMGALATLALVPQQPSVAASAHAGPPVPTLEGRAVLPAETYAPGPPSGSSLARQSPVNGITFPTLTQPVEGFSSIVDGRHSGEYLAMPDNGYGSKAGSRDFLIRAYYVEPDFKTAHGGTGSVAVGEHIQFSDPNDLIGFDVWRESLPAPDRLLTGGDIDPESLQRAKNGDLWVGDEFGPWLLHFDAAGALLEAPFAMPGGLMSPNNPHLNGGVAKQPNSRGIEAMAMSPNGKYLYPILEGATVADQGAAPTRRHVFEFSIADRAFTGRQWEYRTEVPGNFVADLWALDRHRLVVIERDGGLGLNAVFRSVYVLDLRKVDAGGFLAKAQAVNLAEIADPGLVSLPAIHAGDVGLGDPFRVTCESVEAIHVLDGERLLVGCDNNFPNKGRNPGLADDSEFIVVKVPGLKSIG